MRTRRLVSPPSVGSAPRAALLVGLLVGLLLLAACSASHLPALKTPPPSAVATTTPGPRPQPVSGVLAPAPTTCPTAAPLPTTTFAHFGGFVGPLTLQGGPVIWIAGRYFPGTWHLDQNGATAYPSTKIIWEVGPNDAQAATVQLTNLHTGQHAWWGLGDPTAADAVFSPTLWLGSGTPEAVVDAHAHPSPEPGWREFGSMVYLSQAGCYAMEVTWPGGHWRGILAAGR